MSRTVAVMGNSSKKGVTEEIERFFKKAEARLTVKKIDLDTSPDLSRLKADLALIFGGDGTILACARKLAGNPVPCVGVNMGKLGFLAAISVDDLAGSLEWIESGEISPSKRLMLEMPFPDGKKLLALNDVVFSAPQSCRMVTIDLEIGDEYINRYFGDGLIVGTPIGSTAYSLSAGGPLVTPAMSAILVTPICPHHLSSRPLVVPHESRIRVKSVGGPACITFDGQDVASLEQGKWITVRKAENDFMLVEPPGYSFFSTLEKKLDWGKHTARGRS